MIEIQKPFGQIYAIIDPFCEQLGGKVQYIGKHKLGKKENDLQKSLEKYLDDKTKGAKSEKLKESKRPHNVYLREEIRDILGNLYDRPKIECIEVCYSESELNNREEYWRLFFLDFYPNLLNRAPGGYGGTCCGYNKGHIPWNKGLTKETDKRVAAGAENISKALKGQKFSDIRRLHMLESQKKAQSLQNVRDKKRKSMLGKNKDKKASDETKEKQRISHLGKKHTEKTKQKIRKGGKGKHLGKSWNRGLTKDSDQRIADAANKTSKTLTGTIFTLERRKNISEALKTYNMMLTIKEWS